MADSSLALRKFSYESVIDDIDNLNWPGLDEGGVVDAAWAYYFFSVQFQENLEIARLLYPADANLQSLEKEESNTDNLSPWPGVAEPGERMNHCVFMRRVLALQPLGDEKRFGFEERGERYLRAVRATDPAVRALSISSYEDGGLERVFRAMQKMPVFDNPVIAGFRHFIAAHIEFDSDPVNGHGAMTRHIRPDDRILPLWEGFRDILVAFAPGLAVARPETSTAALIRKLDLRSYLADRRPS